MPTILIALLFLNISLPSANGYLQPDTRNLINGTIGVATVRNISNGAEDTYQYTIEGKDENVNIKTEVHTVNDNSLKYPVIFQVRQQKLTESWSLPMKSSLNKTGENYVRSERTLCSLSQEYHTMGVEWLVTVTVSTASEESILYSINATHEKDVIVIGETKEVGVFPLSPQLLQFTFPPLDKSNSTDVDLVIESVDPGCVTVSFQHRQCPFLDLETNIRYTGYWHTMVKKGGMTIPRHVFPDGLFIVLVMHDNDDLCYSRSVKNDTRGNRNHLLFVEKRSKLVKVSLKDSVKQDDYTLALLLPMLLSFVPIVCLMFLGSPLYCCSNLETVYQVIVETVMRRRSRVISGTLPRSRLTIARSGGVTMPRYGVARSGLMMPRTGMTLPLSRLMTAQESLGHFFHSTWTAALFYSLPSIQLVFMYLFTMQISGDLDICYYNFYCAFPMNLKWHDITIWDFNHCYSNIGYVILGILGCLVVKYKEMMKERRRRTGQHPPTGRGEQQCLIYNGQATELGLPSHFGIFYAQCIALVVEGLLSATYHICPNHSNFHHDTCFMYISIILTTMKLYHGRHWNSSSSAITAFCCIAVVLTLDLLGEKFFGVAFWTIFCLIHVGCCVWIIAELLQPQFRDGQVSRVAFRKVWMSLPKNADVLVLIALGTIFNLSMMSWGSFKMPEDFGTHLLILLGGHMLLYFLYYLFIKVWQGENISVQFGVLLILATIFWISGAVCFSQQKSNWQLSPAMSREFNEECVFLNFYDSHDLWHFLSAMALFFTMMALLILDDDVEGIRRDDIKTF